MMIVYRYDLAKFSPSTKLTPQGFLRAPATFTRAGVFEYLRADGSKIRELRPEDEVFHADSLATIQGAPVVEDHPVDRVVSPTNATRLAKGWASEQVDRSDSKVTGYVTIMDAATIFKVRDGDLREISMGYQCSIDPTPGTHPVHGRYDQVQRKIRYNHVALGPSGWGRAGSDVAIRLDAGDAISYPDGGLANGAQSRVSCPGGCISRTDGGSQMETVTIKIGGVDFDEVPKAAGQAIQQDQSRRDAELATVKAEQEALQGRLDAQKAELDKTKKDLSEAKDPARFDSAVSERLALVDQARKILGPDADIKGTSREIQEAVIRKDNADLDLSGKSDDYVQARFDHMVEHFEPAEPKPAPKPGAARRDSRDAKVRTSEQARADMIERNAKAWEQPLAFHRGN